MDFTIDGPIRGVDWEAGAEIKGQLKFGYCVTKYRTRSSAVVWRCRKRASM